MGNDVNIDELLREDSQWKGRAQKIAVLKEKIKRMQGGAADGLTNMTMNSFSPAFGAGGAATQISNMEAMSIAN